MFNISEKLTHLNVQYFSKVNSPKCVRETSTDHIHVHVVVIIVIIVVVIVVVVVVSIRVVVVIADNIHRKIEGYHEKRQKPKS